MGRISGARVASLLISTMVSACAPALSTFQPAHVAPAGHALAEGGLEVAIPTGAVISGLSTAKDLGQRAENGEMLTDAQKLQILDAGVNLVVNSPSIGPHIGVAYTVIDRLEANIRFAGQAFRFGGRYQILKRDTAPFDMTVGLGVSRFSYQFPLSDQIPALHLDNFNRWQIDVPLLIGTAHDFYRVWAGPKLLMTWFETQMTLDIPNQPAVARFDGHATYVGGQGGLALGYRHLFVAAELTIAESFGTAHASISGFSTASAHDTHISTLIVYPSVGLMVEL